MNDGFLLNTVKPLLSGHLRDLPKCPLDRGRKLNRGLRNVITINFQHLLCSVIKFHVVKEAKEAVLYFLQDFLSNLQFIES